ncbi:hypothetical protein M0813_13635 [Anaeramoeba flamelloides]|uniref:Uncharacterized protein n=1 Tax=Anaeramoeba flamelloides TaxID=1746091 RepID=A0ABQ8Z7R0_9EUKA|nr:hypothetical protein M0813_13635 [Anaeramoeba flamelloides]
MSLKKNIVEEETSSESSPFREEAEVNKTPLAIYSTRTEVPTFTNKQKHFTNLSTKTNDTNFHFYSDKLRSLNTERYKTPLDDDFQINPKDTKVHSNQLFTETKTATYQNTIQKIQLNSIYPEQDRKECENVKVKFNSNEMPTPALLNNNINITYQQPSSIEYIHDSNTLERETEKDFFSFNASANFDISNQEHQEQIIGILTTSKILVDNNVNDMYQLLEELNFFPKKRITILEATKIINHVNTIFQHPNITQNYQEQFITNIKEMVCDTLRLKYQNKNLENLGDFKNRKRKELDLEVEKGKTNKKTKSKKKQKKEKKEKTTKRKRNKIKKSKRNKKRENDSIKKKKIELKKNKKFRKKMERRDPKPKINYYSLNHPKKTNTQSLFSITRETGYMEENQNQNNFKNQKKRKKKEKEKKGKEIENFANKSSSEDQNSGTNVGIFEDIVNQETFSLTSSSEGENLHKISNRRTKKNKILLNSNI